MKTESVISNIPSEKSRQVMRALSKDDYKHLAAMASAIRVALLPPGDMPKAGHLENMLKAANHFSESWKEF